MKDQIIIVVQSRYCNSGTRYYRAAIQRNGILGSEMFKSSTKSGAAVKALRFLGVLRESGNGGYILENLR